MSIKICHMTSVHSRYDIRIFEKECVSLAKHGFDVTLLVNDNTSNEIRKGVKIVSLNLKETGKISRILCSRIRRKIFEKAIQINADVFHFHDPELLPVGFKLVKLGKKVIYDCHEDVPRQILVKEWIPSILRKPLSFAFEKYENRAVKKISAILVPTPYLADRFSRLNCNVFQICNFPLLCEFGDFHSNSPSDNSGCYIGDLSYTRGILQIAEATKKANITLYLCGKFESRGLEDKILNSYKHIKYLGFLDRAGVVGILSKSKLGFVTLLPSPNHANSYPIKMFEYMAAGIPVVASNFPVYRQIIEGNNCGICVDPYNVDEIKNAIEFIINNPDKAKIMGVNGRKAVLDKYNWNTQESELLKLYNKITGK